MQPEKSKINYTCSTVAVANYVIKRFKKAGARLSKTKLNHILVYSHLKHILLTSRPLVVEDLSLMHFGLVFESIAKIFENLPYDEDIGPRNYTQTERELGIKLRERVLEKEIKDEEALANIKSLLDESIELFLDKTDSESARVLLDKKGLWYYLAFVETPGNHLINDFTEIDYKEILKLKDRFNM
ncbi:MAG: hypothetical protein BWY14_01300 [Parcubacteria group bacterium ADurb.Bin192]|nr:MAG: hypothetical protein BWY14_01300 [Parcubacteria group bacterium ADurb.Bin192]